MDSKSYRVGCCVSHLQMWLTCCLGYYESLNNVVNIIHLTKQIIDTKMWINFFYMEVGTSVNILVVKYILETKSWWTNHDFLMIHAIAEMFPNWC